MWSARLGYQQRAQRMLAEQFASYQYTSPASRAQYSEGQRRSLDLLERAVQRVANKLLPITELFHDVCMPYKLWDVSLLILNASKHDDAELIARLWRSFIFRYSLLKETCLCLLPSYLFFLDNISELCRTPV
jgi:hypothetical protein